MDDCLERKQFHYFLYSSLGSAYIVDDIGNKKDLYNFVALLVNNRRKVEPNFLGSVCIYKCTPTDLIGILKDLGYQVIHGRYLC